MSDGRKGTIGLVHGYMHRGEHWDPLRDRLEDLGYDTIAPDLPVRDQYDTYAGYARAVAEAFRPAVEDGKRIDLVPHSMGSQLVPYLARILGAGSIRSIIDISGSLGNDDDDSLNDLTTRLLSGIPRQRNSTAFQDATLEVEGGLTMLNPAKIKSLLFGECDADTFVWALERLRLQARPKDAPPLATQIIPGVPRRYLLPENDQIRDPVWAEEAAGRIGALVVKVKGDHSPAISHPDELANTIDGLITDIAANEDNRPLPVLTPRNGIPQFWPSSW